MVVALCAVLFVFFRELLTEIGHLAAMNGEHAILLALSLIDLSLAGNLLLIVIFSGYENFVSRIEVGDEADRPAWMGTLDFSGLKMKLIASIVAISAVALLRAFMGLAERGVEPDPAKLSWMIGLHLTFVFSGVMMALMDWLIQKAEHVGGGAHRE